MLVPVAGRRWGCVTAGSAGRAYWPQAKSANLEQGFFWVTCPRPLDSAALPAVPLLKPSCMARLLVQVVKVGLHLSATRRIRHHWHHQTHSLSGRLVDMRPRAAPRSCCPSLRPGLPPAKGAAERGSEERGRGGARQREREGAEEREKETRNACGVLWPRRQIALAAALEIVQARSHVGQGTLRLLEVG